MFHISQQGLLGHMSSLDAVREVSGWAPEDCPAALAPAPLEKLRPEPVSFSTFGMSCHVIVGLVSISAVSVGYEWAFWHSKFIALVLNASYETSGFCGLLELSSLAQPSLPSS